MNPAVTPVPLDLNAVDTAPTGHNVRAVSHLHNMTVDAATGFATMVEKSEPEFRNTAEQFRGLHATQADRLARMIIDLGGEVDPDGTLMGSVNKAVITVRSWFDEIDDDVMDQVRSGEDNVLEAFDAAIASSIPDQHRAALREMRGELTALLAATSHLD